MKSFDFLISNNLLKHDSIVGGFTPNKPIIYNSEPIAFVYNDANNTISGITIEGTTFTSIPTSSKQFTLPKTELANQLNNWAKRQDDHLTITIDNEQYTLKDIIIHLNNHTPIGEQFTQQAKDLALKLILSD